MASWPDVRSFVRANYPVSSVRSPSLVTAVVDTFGGRRQQVFVERDVSPTGGEWVKVSAAVGLRSQVNLDEVVEVASTMVLGAVHLAGDAVVIAHWQPLESIDSPVVDPPVRLVSCVADLVEHEISGADRF